MAVRPYRTLLAASLLLSSAYVFTVSLPFPGRFAVKAGSVALLAFAFWTRSPRGVAVALLLSSVGDALLDLSPKLFAAGLGAFLCAHLAYTATFIFTGPRPVGLTRARIVAIVSVLIFAASFGSWIAPAAGALAIPVTLYILAITAMVVSSITARFSSGWAPIGAVLFLISDAVLAADKFRNPIPLRDYIVWCTYYAGQFLIAAGSKTSQMSR